ncbi:hypothetical protein BH20ACT14_BH20ACT14_06720 [soil metagenome]
MPNLDTGPGVMRKLIPFACSIAAAAVLGGSAGAAAPDVGVLSVEDGRGMVMLDLNGSVLGRLSTGTLRVTDHTPRDRYSALVVGRKLTQERLGPKTVLYRGQGLRFRMVGGGYRIVVRGSGISVSAVGRGVVSLDGEPRLSGEDVGVYSLADGVDCDVERTLCTPLPDEPQRFTLGSPSGDGSRVQK